MNREHSLPKDPAILDKAPRTDSTHALLARENELHARSISLRWFENARFAVSVLSVESTTELLPTS